MRVKNPTAYDAFIQAVVNDLGIEYVNLHWRETLRKNVGGYATPTDVYILKYLSRTETMRVIAHELRHVYQFQTGMLTQSYHWMGKAVKPLHVQRGSVPNTYQEQPWEQDANKYALEAISRFYQLVRK